MTDYLWPTTLIPARSPIVLRIGEISAELETAQGERTELHPTDGKKSKAQTLKAAGISTSAAHRVSFPTACIHSTTCSNLAKAPPA